MHSYSKGWENSWVATTSEDRGDGLEFKPAWALLSAQPSFARWQWQVISGLICGVNRCISWEHWPESCNWTSRLAGGLETDISAALGALGLALRAREGLCLLIRILRGKNHRRTALIRTLILLNRYKISQNSINEQHVITLDINTNFWVVDKNAKTRDN